MHPLRIVTPFYSVGVDHLYNIPSNHASYLIGIAQLGNLRLEKIKRSLSRSNIKLKGAAAHVPVCVAGNAVAPVNCRKGNNSTFKA